MNQLASTLPANLARSNFYQLLDEVGTNLRRFAITHRGKMRAVLMPIEEVEGWEETLEIMSDKKLMSDIVQAKKDIKAGKVYTLKEVKKSLKLDED